MGQQESTVAELPKVVRPLASLPRVACVPEVAFVHHNGRICEGGDLPRTHLRLNQTSTAPSLGSPWEQKWTDFLHTYADKQTTAQQLCDSHAPVAVPAPGLTPTPTLAPDADVKQGTLECGVSGESPEYAPAARVVQGVPCFEAEEEIHDRYGGFERFHIAVKLDFPDAYQILTCLQEGEFVNCVHLSGESLKLRVPDGNKPFGSWLLSAVKARDIGCSGLVCLVDGEGVELAKEAQATHRSLEGETGHVCCQMSGAAFIEEHLTAKEASLQSKVFASKSEEMKRLRELLSQESSVTVETAKERRANRYGIFSNMYCHVQAAGLVVEMTHKVGKPLM